MLPLFERLAAATIAPILHRIDTRRRPVRDGSSRFLQGDLVTSEERRALEIEPEHWITKGQLEQLRSNRRLRR